MIDEKKIEEAAQEAADLYEQDLPTMSYYEDTEVDGQHHFCQQFGAELFKEGAHWAINKFLKNLFHAACEVPWNDNGKVLSFSREIGYRKLYDMNTMLNETTCNTYKEMWEKEVKAYRWSDWIYVDDLFGLITKGGKK